MGDVFRKVRSGQPLRIPAPPRGVQRQLASVGSPNPRPSGRRLWYNGRVNDDGISSPARPTLTEFEAWWRSKLPVWLQWVLCWPCAAISAVLIVQLFKLMMTSRDDFGCVVYAIDLAYPAGAFAVFLFLFWSMVPRGKYELCIAFIALRSLFIVALVGLTIAKLAGVEALQDSDPLDYKWWLAMVAEVLAMIAGIVAVREMKQEYDRQTSRSREAAAEIGADQ